MRVDAIGMMAIVELDDGIGVVVTMLTFALAATWVVITKGLFVPLMLHDLN